MRGKATLRKLLLVGAAVISAAGLSVTALFFYFASSDGLPRGSVRMPGLEQRVRVFADSFGIPTLVAAGEEDLLRVQGYVHASERLWQLELFRRVAQGRLSELFGEQALATDRLMRTLNLWGASGRALERLSPEERRRLAAYAEGVNARLSERDRPLPPEFVLLRFRPEPWNARSSLAVGSVMNLDLSHWRNDLARFWASRHIDAAKLPYLNLGYPEWGPTILEGMSVPPPDASTPQGPAGSVSGLTSGSSAARRPEPPAARRRAAGWNPFEVVERFAMRAASNAWVVAGTRTASGAPILANDMHLGLRAPALWYLMALHADSADVHVAGLTLPGIPGVIVGFNRQIAWGFTNGMVDDMDFVVEEIDGNGRVREPDGWAELAVRQETLRVRGRRRPEILQVRETRRGPLISDVLPGIGADLSAVWIPLRPSASTTGVWQMNVARSVAEFEKAVEAFPQPHQNVVFGSRDGHIGYRLAGRIPIRPGWDGSEPVTREEYRGGWASYRAPATHPSLLDPPRGYIVTANNLQSRALGRQISADYAAPFRALRLEERIAAERGWTVESTYRLQHDTHSVLADRLLPQAVQAARRVGDPRAVARLARWDRRVEVASRGAPLFYSWAYRLRSLIAADEYSADPSWGFFPISAFLATVEEGEESPWVDDVRTDTLETLTGLMDRAMRDAIRVTRGRSWGELHFERHLHPLGRIGWLQRLIGFDVGPYPAPGGPHTVRPDDYRRWARLDSASWVPPWESSYGPSERYVAELFPGGPRGWFLIPTGQSGNPFSRHYRQLLPRWRGGELIEIALDELSAERKAVLRFTVVPQRRPGFVDAVQAPR